MPIIPSVQYSIVRAVFGCREGSGVFFVRDSNTGQTVWPKKTPDPFALSVAAAAHVNRNYS